MASLVATSLALSLYLYSQKDRPNWSGPLHLFIAVTGALLIIILQSRTGQLGTAVALLLLGPYIIRGSYRQLLIWFATFALGLGLGVNNLYYAEDNASFKREAAIYTQDNTRRAHYGQSLDLVRKNTLMGVGYGRFEEAWQTGYAQSPDRSVDTTWFLQNLQHPHNEILYWAAEGGLLPVAGMLLIAFSFLQLLRQHSWPQSLAWLAVLTPIGLHTQTEMPFYTSALHWLVFLGLLNFIDASGGQRRMSDVPNVRLMRVCAVLFPLIGAPFMLTGLHTHYLLDRFQAAPVENMELLNEIVNPVIALDKIQGARMGLQFIWAMSEQDSEALQDYIDWADKLASTEPRIYLYYNRILALRQLEQDAAADTLLLEARWRFADHKELAPLLDGSAEASFILPATTID
jgi:O-antigen polymerase